MLKVKDFVENKTNYNTRVRLHLQEDNDPCTAFYELIYDGMIQDIPLLYQELTVINKGWLIGAQCDVLEVIKD